MCLVSYSCFYAEMCMRARVCLPPRVLITSGMMGVIWNPYDWLNKFYSCYMTTVVDIINLAWPWH